MNQTSERMEMPEINYEELEQPPYLDESLLLKIDLLIQSNNWMESHQCVTMVRQINKFYPQYIADVVTRYSNALLDLFNHGKTQIYKNILRLIKEIFDQGQEVNVEKAVYPFLPLLLKKSATELGHIKEMSQLVLASFSQNCGYDISFTIAAQFCLDKNVKVSEISIKLLARLLQKVGSSIVNLNPNTLQCLMQSLLLLIKGKRENLKTSSLDICMFIYGQIGSQNYLNLMQFSFPNEDIQVMGSAMQVHRNSEKAKPVPLAKVLQQRKTQMLIMKENNPNFVNMNNQNYNNTCNSNYY